MNHFMNKKVVAVALTAGLVFGSSGVAVAYFTSDGSGRGTASVGTTGATDFIINTDGIDGTLYPGAAALPFDVIAFNSGYGTEYLGSVSVAINTYNNDGTIDAATAAGADIPGCLASWFTVTSTATINQSIASLGSYTLTGVGEPTIQLTEAGVNQDACQGHTVGIIFGNPV